MENLNYAEIAKKHMYTMNNYDNEASLESLDPVLNNFNNATFVNENQIMNNQGNLVMIDSKYLNYYGDFIKSWKEFKNEEGMSFWYNEKINRSVWDNPTFIHICLAENKVEKTWVPLFWKSFNEDFIKIKFKNKRKMFIDRVKRVVLEKIVKEEKEKEINDNITQIPEGMISGQKYIKQFVLEKVREQMNEGISKEFENENHDFLESDIINTNKDSIIIKQENTFNEDKTIKNQVKAGNSNIGLDEVSAYDSQNNQYEKEIKEFRELLREKNIGINALYQKELPKIVYEERYKNLPQEFRRKTFDEYVKDFLPKQKHLTAVDRKKNQEKLKNLLKEMIDKNQISLKTSISEFQELMKTNPIYISNTMMDRDFLFNEAKLRIKRIEEESN